MKKIPLKKSKIEIGWYLLHLYWVQITTFYLDFIENPLLWSSFLQQVNILENVDYDIIYMTCVNNTETDMKRQHKWLTG